MILFLLRKLFYITNTVGFNHIPITYHSIYICNQIRVYIMNRKANLHIDLKNLILMNICLVLLISNSLVLVE